MRKYNVLVAGVGRTRIEEGIRPNIELASVLGQRDERLIKPLRCGLHLDQAVAPSVRLKIVVRKFKAAQNGATSRRP